MFKVLRPGLLTTIQDAGRFGWYHIGMPPSGAMEIEAAEITQFLSAIGLKGLAA